MKKYKIVIDTAAYQDIQNATGWYNVQSAGLGARFQKQVKTQINMLKNNPSAHHIRYAEVRCMLIKNFPFLVHFIVDEVGLVIEIFAVLHTSRNPKIWEQKR
jgi:hypothetical protein